MKLNMLRKWIVTAIVCVLPAMALAGCQPSPEQPNTSVPAIGTPMAKEQEKQPITLPEGMGGAVIINNTLNKMSVVVSGTLAVVLPNSSFLFILPPAKYTFQIYRGGYQKAIPREEELVAGKPRFIYMMT